MKVGLLGGVFNPPHFGHLMIARQILDFTDVEEVWFLPNYGQSPPKVGVAQAADRLAMTGLLRLPGARVSAIEIDNRLDGKTINLLPLLPPGNSYVFLMGSDWLPSFSLWDRWEELLARLPFYVFPRNGHPVTPMYPNMTEVKHELLITSDISSTKVRLRLERGLAVDQFVPREVLEYIREHHLYESHPS
jgi:nicotinate-nucleotide adenylyltransferase